MSDMTVAELAKNGRERILIRVTSYKGAIFADLRYWVVAEDGSLRPTPKGIAIRPDLIPGVVVGLQTAQAVLAGDDTPGTGKAA